MRNCRLRTIVVLVVICCGFVCAEDRWVWSQSGRNRRDRAYREDSIDRQKANDKYRAELYSQRQEREREPTTKRPLPGIPQNDDIDDYVDSGDKNLGSRNYPYAANGFNGGQYPIGGAGGGGGFNNYPGAGFGGINNGILVGPGGPTGIIGRPQQYYPGGGAGGFPGGLGQPGYGGGNLGYPAQGGNFGGAGAFPNGYPQGGAQYPGVYNGGQYSGGQFPNGQYGGAQYPGVGQYPGGNGQYLGGNGQYPGGNGQYPGGSPFYTEGYGLAPLNGYPPIGGGGYQPNSFGIGGYNGYGVGYDDTNQTKRKLQIEDKSAGVESRNAVDRRVDDKINNNLKKTT